MPKHFWNGLITAVNKQKTHKLTAKEYYARKRELERQEHDIDRQHLRAQWELNEQMIALEREWDKQQPKEEPVRETIL